MHVDRRQTKQIVGEPDSLVGLGEHIPTVVKQNSSLVSSRGLGCES